MGNFNRIYCGRRGARPCGWIRFRSGYRALYWLVGSSSLEFNNLWCLGTAMLALLGVIGGIWSEKFDQIAMVTNFIVTPMTFLSGTFYSIDRLTPIWQNLAHLNPFFFMIDGFRSGFIGTSDAFAMKGMVVLIVVDIVLWLLALSMLRRGYKIKH